MKPLQALRMFTVALVVPLVVVTASASGNASITSDGGRQGFLYPKLNTAAHLYVIKGSAMNDAERVMIETLQGIVAQNKAEIYIDSGGSYTAWLKILEVEYGITHEYVRSPWDLIARFKSKLNGNGFIQYDPSYEEINVACTLSGVMRYAAVANSLSVKAKANGLETG